MDSDVKYFHEYWEGTQLSYPNVAPESPKFARSIAVGNLSTFLQVVSLAKPEFLVEIEVIGVLRR